MGVSSKSNELISGCSEGTGNKKLYAQKKRAEFITKIKAANLKALRDAAQAKRVIQVRDDLELVAKLEGHEGLERQTIKAFNIYREQAQVMRKKKTMTEKDQIALEKARLEFAAIKKAKKLIQINASRKKMTEKLLKENGLEEIEEDVEVAIDELDEVSRKRDEFPDDEETNMLVEVAEAKVDAIAEAAEEIVEAREVGIKEKPKMKKLINKAKEKRQYNLMWKDAKTYYLTGRKEELATMMETVTENF